MTAPVSPELAPYELAPPELAAASSPEAARHAGAFEAAMWALARPGVPQILPEAGSAPGPCPGALMLARALLDRETTFHAADPQLAAALSATGARAAPPEIAAFVFAGDTGDAAALAARLSPGDHAYPDRGATLIAPAAFGTDRPGPATRLRLTGPGIDGAVQIGIGGIDPAFWPARAARIRYPLGFELLLIDGDRLLGLPRSTNVEVL